MTLDPESASLLAQATEAAKRQGTLDATLEADTATQAITGEARLGVTHRETWGEWFARVALRGTAKRDTKPSGSARVEVGARWLTQEPVRVEHGVPRRNRIDLLQPAEKLLLDAIHAIETDLGADVRLTRAQTLIQEARDLVADVIEGRQP